MSRVNGATGALSIGPSAGYTLFFVFVHVLLLLKTYTWSREDFFQLNLSGQEDNNTTAQVGLVFLGILCGEQEL